MGRLWDVVLVIKVWFVVRLGNSSCGVGVVWLLVRVVVSASTRWLMLDGLGSLAVRMIAVAPARTMFHLLVISAFVGWYLVSCVVTW